MPSVLFVCTANRFRSPLAATLFLRAVADEEIERASPWNIGKASDWRAGSAGTWTVDGEAALPVVVDAATQLDIDLSGHRSVQVNDRLLADYDLILTMQASQKEALQSEFPRHSDRIYLMSHVVERGSYDIPDSFDSPEETLSVAAEMDELIRRGLRFICVLAIALHNTRDRSR